MYVLFVYLICIFFFFWVGFYSLATYTSCSLCHHNTPFLPLQPLCRRRPPLLPPTPPPRGANSSIIKAAVTYASGSDAFHNADGFLFPLSGFLTTVSLSFHAPPPRRSVVQAKRAYIKGRAPLVAKAVGVLFGRWESLLPLYWYHPCSVSPLSFDTLPLCFCPLPPLLFPEQSAGVVPPSLT